MNPKYEPVDWRVRMQDQRVVPLGVVPGEDTGNGPGLIGEDTHNAPSRVWKVMAVAVIRCWCCESGGVADGLMGGASSVVCVAQCGVWGVMLSMLWLLCGACLSLVDLTYAQKARFSRLVGT